jgi:UPF0755 protein
VFQLIKKTVLWLVLLGVTAAVALGLGATWWLHSPLPVRNTTPAGYVDVEIPPGTSARGVSTALVSAGVDTPALWLLLWFRASGQAGQIKAGSYELPNGLTPRMLLDKLVRGEQAVRRFTLVEGWNYWQLLAALKQAEHLRFDLPENPDPAALMRALGRPESHPEGRFFPDTYLYPKNSSASQLLLQAANAMDQKLAEAWAARHPDVPLRSPEEALILASIVEKETGLPQDRGQVAGVFTNRLRIGMRLQTDPTVIYGQGPRFEGRLRRRHLDTDNPYNTYTRAGLPPTPIAMPGWASLLAAVQPQDTPAMYFVSRGDGSSHFSATLAEHNAAVRRYILSR